MGQGVGRIGKASDIRGNARAVADGPPSSPAARLRRALGNQRPSCSPLPAHNFEGVGGGAGLVRKLGVSCCGKARPERLEVSKIFIEIFRGSSTPREEGPAQVALQPFWGCGMRLQRNLVFDAGIRPQMSRTPIQKRIIEVLDGYALRGVDVAARLAPSSPSAVRRALVALGRRGAIVQDRDRRWSLPEAPSTPGAEAAVRRLRQGMRRAAENVEIAKLKKENRMLRAEIRELSRLLRESEINPYQTERMEGLRQGEMITRGFSNRPVGGSGRR